MEHVSDRRKLGMRARQAAEYLGVSLMTLHEIEKRGQLMPFHTPGGHRRYSLEMLEEYARNNRRSNALGNADGSD